MQLQSGSAATRVLFVLVLAISFAARAYSQGHAPESSVHFGLTSSVVESEISLTDTLAATQMWADTMGKGIGLWKESDANIYSDAARLVTAVNKDEADIVALSTQEYLEVENRLHAIPTLTYMQAGHIDSQYLVLVRQDSIAQTIRDLRGLRIALLKGGRNALAPLWLDVVLSESGIREKKHLFFKEVREAQKPSQVILPVFFKQMEAGIVLKSAFDTAVTLNPQIGKQVRILATSPKLVMLVICLRANMPMELREFYLKQALKLHETPSGLQAFNIFKLDRLVPWDPSYFDNVRDLMKKRKIVQAASQLQGRPDSGITGK